MTFEQMELAGRFAWCEFSLYVWVPCRGLVAVSLPEVHGEALFDEDSFEPAVGVAPACGWHHFRGCDCEVCRA